MSERTKTRFDHLADLAIAAVKRQPSLHTLNKGSVASMHSIYASAAPTTLEEASSQPTIRNATTSEIATMLKRGETATISQQVRHRKEGGRGRRG